MVRSSKWFKILNGAKIGQYIYCRVVRANLYITITVTHFICTSRLSGDVAIHYLDSLGKVGMLFIRFVETREEHSCG
jgi:hypothetical protein